MRGRTENSETTRGRYGPFPKAEFEGRLARLRKGMAAQGLDALLLTSKENVIYVSGLMTIGWDSKHRPMGLIVPADQRSPVLIIPESLEYVAQESSWIEDVRLWGGVRVPGAPPDPILGIRNAMEDLKLATARVGWELGYGTRLGMPQADYEALRAALPDMTVVDGSGAMWQARMIKTAAEIEAIRQSCAVTSRAFEAGFRTMREGMTERELAGVFFRELAGTNYKPGFVMIRSGRDKYRMINVEPFDKPFERGDLVVVDLGATYKDYWSDFMRMASIGGPSAEQRRFFECELAAQSAGVAAIRPGIPAREIFNACADVIKAMGFNDHARIERVGH
ncbi:MAG: M24 family metallopeptidase, partial [Armatimonadota bacterium]